MYRNTIMLIYSWKCRGWLVGRRIYLRCSLVYGLPIKFDLVKSLKKGSTELKHIIILYYVLN